MGSDSDTHPDLLGGTFFLYSTGNPNPQETKINMKEEREGLGDVGPEVSP